MSFAARKFAVILGQPPLTIDIRGTVDDEGLHGVVAEVAPALAKALRTLGAADGLPAAQWLKQELIDAERLLPANYIEPISAAVERALARESKPPGASS